MTKLAEQTGHRIMERKSVADLEKAIGNIESTLRKHSALYISSHMVATTLTTPRPAGEVALVRQKRDRVLAKISSIESIIAEFNQYVTVNIIHL